MAFGKYLCWTGFLQDNAILQEKRLIKNAILLEAIVSKRKIYRKLLEWKQESDETSSMIMQ